MTPDTGWMDQLLIVALASARFGSAFAFLPLFAPDTVPPMVRNSLILTLGGVAYWMTTGIDPAALGIFAWARLLLKEAVAGVVIGFFFGTLLWAMEAAGEIIDAKVGATIGQVLEPLGGNQVSLNGALLARLANVLFASVGGLMLLVATILESFAIWPMTADWQSLDMRGLVLFEGEFGRLMTLAVVLAAPVIVFLYVVDASLGLLNRFAQQLNVFQLSMSIKAWAATALVLMLIPLFAQLLVGEIASRNDVVRALIGALAR
ncbi:MULTISPECIES: type III secretion system export apparatus subunit SctT [unclassified Sphingomonas]|uniref:type III secretion system export apparatus subunit SctT n=1 Tax=unclassified Sphingomonas TaxID=196159 RepID=UPI00082B5BEF|nr:MULTISPECIES: type III secretion system export apparatus subunit SctT [unclassified Sphingomonas]